MTLAEQSSAQIDELKTQVDELKVLLKEQEELNNHLRKKLKKATAFVPKKTNSYETRAEFEEQLVTSRAAFQKIIDDYDFLTVLDVGSGGLNHAKLFTQYGKKVTTVDFGNSVYYEKSENKQLENIKQIFGDFNTLQFEEQFDLVWLSHILEHQLNVHDFLKKAVSLVKEDGLICITVPPLKHQIVGGHVSLWNAGLILYRLILCGLDCSTASILSYGYNISVIVRKKTVILDEIHFDAGDIRKLKAYFPADLNFKPNEHDDPFDGNISRLNW